MLIRAIRIQDPAPIFRRDAVRGCLAADLADRATAILMWASYNFPAGHHRTGAEKDEDDETKSRRKHEDDDIKKHRHGHDRDLSNVREDEDTEVRRRRADSELGDDDDFGP